MIGLESLLYTLRDPQLELGLHICIYKHTWVHSCRYINKFIHICVCVYKRVCVFVYIYTCAYIYMCVCAEQQKAGATKKEATFMHKTRKIFLYMHRRGRGRKEHPLQLLTSRSMDLCQPCRERLLPLSPET